MDTIQLLGAQIILLEVSLIIILSGVMVWTLR